MRKIGLFGGTFDPVHLGHIQLAETAKDALGLDEVRFIPCQISPHKSDTPPASGEDRAEMLRLATADLPWAVVDEYELHEADPSYSFATAEAMASKFPDARLFWIMGGDQWDALPRWKNPERLAARVEFIVYQRGTLPQSREGFRFHVINGEHPASATAIRGAIAAGLGNHPWLHSEVWKWIESRGSYRP